MNSIVVHYQEIALKGKNRPWFLGRLVRNLRRALSDLDVRSVRALMGRIEVVLGPEAIATGGRRAHPRVVRHRELLLCAEHADRTAGPQDRLDR